MTEQNEIIISLQTNLEMEQAKNVGSEQFINELTKANIFLRAQCTIVSKKIQEVMKQNMTNKETSDAKIAKLEAKIVEMKEPIKVVDVVELKKEIQRMEAERELGIPV